MKKCMMMMAVVLSLFFLGGCSGDKSASATVTPVTIVATDNGWDSQKLHNAIAGLVVEHAYDGYELEISTASTAMNWQSVISNEVDLDIESWTENIASYADDLAKGDVVELGVLVGDSKQGVYVPRYVIEGDPEMGIEPMAAELKTVEDLKNYAHVFVDDEDKTRGRMYGSIPGWMADGILYKKYEYYGLDEMYTYVRLGSEATLFASLVSAYNLGEPWVGYSYEPAWVIGKLDLVLLEDAPYEYDAYLEGQTEFPSQALKIISNSQFAEKAPDLVEFFANYKTGSGLISSALYHLEDTGESHEDTAAWLLRENDYLLDEWLPSDNAAKLRDYLSTL